MLCRSSLQPPVRRLLAVDIATNDLAADGGAHVHKLEAIDTAAASHHRASGLRGNLPRIQRCSRWFNGLVADVTTNFLAVEVAPTSLPPTEAPTCTSLSPSTSLSSPRTISR
ncbi:hypothetical protein ACP70R_003042 [Stipagrostis hirtigluma subsp. patula]